MTYSKLNQRFRVIGFAFFVFSFCVVALGNSPVLAAETDATAEKIRQALSADIRTAEDKARDENRKPAQTLEFFGLQSDMQVLEIFPGSGWYTRILGNVLKDDGKLHLALGLRFLGDGLQEWGFGHVSALPEAGSGMAPSALHKYIFNFDNIDFQLQDLDMALTFRNAHNLSAEARAKLNKAVFAALKPGGIYGVIDHTRRHMAPHSEEIWRRVDPVLIIKEALDAGFELEAFSDLHRQADDGLIYDSTHDSIKRNSDRFTLKFRKPNKSN